MKKTALILGMAAMLIASYQAPCLARTNLMHTTANSNGSLYALIALGAIGAGAYYCTDQDMATAMKHVAAERLTSLKSIIVLKWGTVKRYLVDRWHAQQADPGNNPIHYVHAEPSAPDDENTFSIPQAPGGPVA